MNGTVKALCIARRAGTPMQQRKRVYAIAGRGLKGDRYASGNGKFNQGAMGKRQVTLMNVRFFKGSGFKFTDTRRNIFTEGVELMWLVGREFTIGKARLRGIKYCDPCNRPSRLARKRKSFKEVFSDVGGIVAEVLQGGYIKVGDPIIPPPKGY